MGPRPSEAGDDADSGDLCVLMTTEAPPDPGNVRVKANDVVVPQSATNGWQYGSNTQTVVISGSYCDDLRAGKVTSYTMIFGCGSVPIP